NLDIIIFDKTGTLTKDTPALAGVAAAAGMNDDGLLALAAAVEADSEHPIAKAIVQAAEHRGLAKKAATQFEALAGRGARGVRGWQRVVSGGPRLLEESHLTVAPDLAERVKSWTAAGQTVLYAARDNTVINALAVENEIRPESADAVRSLHDIGLRVAMI